MTVEEELSRLEEDLRRLKIEYEAYFNGGAPYPPNDLVFRVETAVKRCGGGQVEMTFRQRFRFNQLSQGYAVHSDLWRKKLKLREEGGPARPRPPAAPIFEFKTTWSDPDSEPEKVDQLRRAILTAREAAGHRSEPIDPARFAAFVRDKTLQCKNSLSCSRVEFSIGLEDGRVTLRATKAG